ncbi:substrate-binding domain-containing protein [Paenibacillus sp. R14(2021)]|uniref:substrate-binding domain-containing protein n=1 Tax=Paenibacillus sp. R14(2021) TaxID=2859228 RepID=UPI001C615657|nr:substrate-binding domain-containing protein [Paenibacillus sp. R14(2021)]
MRKQRLTILLVLVLLAAAFYAVFFSRLFMAPEHGDTTITVVLKSLNVRSDYWQTMSSGAQTAAKELGVELDLQGPLQESDTEAQIRALQAAIERKPDAIAVAPVDDPRMPALLDAIREAGIPLVVMDTAPKLTEAPAFVANDHLQAGRQAGDTAAGLTKKRPVVAVFSSSLKSPVSKQRYEGVKQSLQAHGGQIFGTYYTGDSEQSAYDIAKSLLTKPSGITAFITLNEGSTLGVAKALKEAKKTDVYKLVGFESTIYEIQLLEEGSVNALVVPKPFNVGYLGVKTAMKLIDGRKSAGTTRIGAAVVTRANMYLPENQQLLFPFTVIQ